MGPGGDPAPVEDLDRRIDHTAARQIESTGNIVSGYGEHGLANQLWALAADLRDGTPRG